MSILTAHWPAPPNVHALTTTRSDGHSIAPYDSNNLGLHVGDNPYHVMANRNALASCLHLPGDPHWLEQTHSAHSVIVEEEENRLVDATVTRQRNTVLAVMTADCQPILLCNKQGTEIAAIHAGWRGLVNGIIESALAKMQSPPTDILAWIGPAICQNCYEVGEDVRDLYLCKYPFSKDFFTAHGDRWLINLAQISEMIFYKSFILSVYQSKICTFEQKSEFFSYRRDQQTGRMVSLIWFH